MTIDDVKLSEEGRFLPWGKVAAEKLQKVEDWISGGGNPNRVETITATLANPWGDITEGEWVAFCDAYYTGNASASLSIDASSLDFAEPFRLTLSHEQNEPNFISCYVSTFSSTAEAMNAIYRGSFPIRLVEAGYFNGESVIDLAEYATLPTTLTIIWHPLPESE